MRVTPRIRRAIFQKVQNGMTGKRDEPWDYPSPLTVCIVATPAREHEGGAPRQAPPDKSLCTYGTNRSIPPDILTIAPVM
jgi:hypothetical protein